MTAISGLAVTATRLGSAAAGFGFGEPAAAEVFGGDAGEVGLDVEDGCAVEHVDAVDVKGGSLAAEEADGGEADWVWPARGAGGEDAVRAVVGGRVGGEVEAVDAVEGPEDVEVGEALDVGEAGGELGQEAEDAFGFVLRAEAFGDIGGGMVWADDVADGVEGEGLRGRDRHAG